MFFMPVDLFTSFIEGREKAIDRNWNDLNQANQVERGWLDNDAKQLSNWYTQDSYLDKLQQLKNKTIASNIDRDLLVAAFPGDKAQATLMSDHNVNLANNLRTYMDALAEAQTQGILGNAAEIGAKGEAQQKHAKDLFDALARHNVQNAKDAIKTQPLRTKAEEVTLTGQIKNALGTGTGTGTGSVPGAGSVVSMPGKYKQGDTTNTTSPVSSTPSATNKRTASDLYADAMNTHYGTYGSWGW